MSARLTGPSRLPIITHAAFEVGVVLKGIDGLLEIAGAALLWAVSPGQIRSLVAALTQHELSEDPHDVVARLLVRAAAHLSISGKLFAFLYLLAHGVVKVGLVVALLRTKLWAYPLAIAVFGAFGVYETYRYLRSPSVEMLVLTILDVFVMVLTWIEYRRLMTPR